jgi:hypothetical protein
MAHPDKGLFQAFFDRELSGTESDGLRAHLEECQDCRRDLDSLELVSRQVEEALSALDVEPPLAEARSRLLSRRVAPRRRPFLAASLTLPRAASIALLLTGAVVTALPGSPVRRWMRQGWSAITGSVQEETSPTTPVETPLETETTPLEGIPQESGVSVPALEGGVEIWIRDLAPEADLRVLWTDGDEAWVYAGEGTRFNRAEGRLEASGPPGAIRVEIPRTLRHVVLGLNGTVLLRKTGEELEITGPVQERSPSEIRFEGLGGSNDGPP